MPAGREQAAAMLLGARPGRRRLPTGARGESAGQSAHASQGACCGRRRPSRWAISAGARGCWPVPAPPGRRCPHPNRARAPNPGQAKPSQRPAATAAAAHQPRSTRPSLGWNRPSSPLKPPPWEVSLGHQRPPKRLFASRFLPLRRANATPQAACLLASGHEWVAIRD